MTLVVLQFSLLFLYVLHVTIVVEKLFSYQKNRYEHICWSLVGKSSCLCGIEVLKKNQQP